MDISTALWAAAIGAGASLATIAIFGAVAGRRFRSRMHARRGSGVGGPPWAWAGAGGRCAHHAPFAMAAGGHGHWHGRCAKRGEASDTTSTDAEAPASTQAEA